MSFGMILKQSKIIGFPENISYLDNALNLKKSLINKCQNVFLLKMCYINNSFLSPESNNILTLEEKRQILHLNMT